VKWRCFANYVRQAYSAVNHEISPGHFRGHVLRIWNRGLDDCAVEAQPWNVRYVQVAIGLRFIVLGILIPLSLHRLGYGW
jgi:hypothetical protein